jgi:hypothetical protein
MRAAARRRWLVPEGASQLFGLNPAEQVLLADCGQNGRVVTSHVLPDHSDDLVIVVAAGDKSALAPN